MTEPGPMFGNKRTDHQAPQTKSTEEQTPFEKMKTMNMQELQLIGGLVTLSKRVESHTKNAVENLLTDVEKALRNSIKENLTVDKEFWMMVHETILMTQADTLSQQHFDELRFTVENWKAKPLKLLEDYKVRLAAVGWTVRA